MIDPKDIRPLTEFQRNAKASIARLKKSRRPEFLTVNGKATLVVLDAASFRDMAELAEETLERRKLEEAIGQMRRGEGRPMADVFRDLRDKVPARTRVRRRSA